MPAQRRGSAAIRRADMGRKGWDVRAACVPWGVRRICKTAAVHNVCGTWAVRSARGPWAARRACRTCDLCTGFSLEAESEDVMMIAMRRRTDPKQGSRGSSGRPNGHSEAYSTTFAIGLGGKYVDRYPM